MRQFWVFEINIEGFVVGVRHEFERQPIERNLESAGAGMKYTTFLVRTILAAGIGLVVFKAVLASASLCIIMNSPCFLFLRASS